MADRYFFARGATQHGPYSADEMRGLATSGQILPADSVWQEGAQQRFPASRVKNLFADLIDPADAQETDVAPTEPAETPQAAAEKAAESATVPAAEKQVRPAEKERPRRVVSIKGGVLISQDGKHVQYRKKCATCGYEEQGRSTQFIRPGSMKIPFFCRKCRKGRTTEMTGIS